MEISIYSRRKIDLLEKNSNKERIDSGSRTSSSSSLDKVDGPAQQSINGSNNYQTNPAILEMNNGRVCSLLIYKLSITKRSKLVCEFNHVFKIRYGIYCIPNLFNDIICSSLCFRYPSVLQRTW